MALAVDVVPSDRPKRGSPPSELPGLAVLRKRRGPWDKRPPCYLCVKGHAGLAEEEKEQPSVFSTLTVADVRTMEQTPVDITSVTHICKC